MKNIFTSARPKQRKSHKGFTLIELMIVLAIIAIILALALPVYSNYTIRAKVGEALSIAAPAKTAVGASCSEDPTITALTPSLAGHTFGGSTYVASLNISGPCSAPVITMVTQNTGAPAPITLTLTGSFVNPSQHISWNCVTTSSNIYVPSSCRS